MQIQTDQAYKDRLYNGYCGGGGRQETVAIIALADLKMLILGQIKKTIAVKLTRIFLEFIYHFAKSGYYILGSVLTFQFW